MKYQILTLVVSGIALSGCGAAIEAVNATKSMPGIMNDMNSKMDHTNTGMDKTNEAVRLQKMGIGLDNLFKAENTEDISPPTGMLPGGRLLAENATAKELIEISYLWLTYVNEVTLPEDAKANPAQLPQVIAKYNHTKMVKLTALEIVAALASQEKVEQIYQEQIVNGGVYERTAYAFMAARAMFIRDYMIDSKILSKKVTNLEMAQEALTQISYLQYLNQLPESDRFVLKVTGMITPDPNIS